jgi:hypothetical protein
MALTRPEGSRREQALGRYPAEIGRRWGRYYRLGNLAAHQVFGRVGYGPLLRDRVMDSPVLLAAMARLLTQLTDEPSQDGIDAVLNTLIRLVPAR